MRNPAPAGGKTTGSLDFATELRGTMVRFFPVNPTRFGPSAALVMVILAALLAGCGGDDSASGASGSLPAGDAPAAKTSGDSVLAAQENPPQTTPTNLSPQGEPLAATVNGAPITVAELERERDRERAHVLQRALVAWLLAFRAGKGEFEDGHAQRDQPMAIAFSFCSFRRFSR